ncbi:helix-turn-helix domain-containing protein [Paenibacillus larvae]|uniref:helix-turn-helix domain-containing protein n=1 Tax=Paenibacillus larvae TaxID=1464 RepID=UPI0033C060B8
MVPNTVPGQINIKKNLNNFRKILKDFKIDFNFRTTIQLIGKELNIRYFYIIFFTIYKNTKKFSLWTLTCNRKLKILLVFIKLI